MNEPVSFLSLSALARRLDVSAPRAARLRERGIWVPDGICGRDYIFQASRLPKLKLAAEHAMQRNGKVATVALNGVKG